ncbi:MAG: tetratricopeptide repeat protein [Magnetococcales bacterium]|nr:tetratricopeptide repeat protein [Magnetococcales bacterium]
MANKESELTVAGGYSQAVDHYGAGRYLEADKLCTAILQVAPNHLDAINLLGNIAQKIGRFEMAAQKFQQAISIDDSRAMLYYNLATSLYPLGRQQEAIAALQTALGKDPGNEKITGYLDSITSKSSEIEASLHRAIALHKAGQLDEGIYWYNKVLELQPDNIAALSNLGIAFKNRGQLDRAVIYYNKTLSIKPDHLEAHYNLAAALQEQGELKAAIASYQHALTIDPNYAKAHYNLGNILFLQGELDDAVECYQKAIAIQPDYFEAYSNLGAARQGQGQLDAAIASYQKSLAIKPDYAEAYNNSGLIFQEQGKLEEAVTSFKKALTIQPDFTIAHSNLLFIISYYTLYSAPETLKQHQQWDEIHGRAGKSNRFSHSPIKQNKQLLKIGYVSGDFRRHPVSNFMAAIIKNHHRNKTRVYCYSNVIKPDSITSEFQASADVWCNTLKLSDQQVAQQIYDDGIDILVDLTGHTKGSRLKVFTYKPAPIQVSYLGYCTTTGLETMDYWLTDKVLTPEDRREESVETIVHLPNCWVCYQPGEKTAIAKSEKRSHDGVVLGSFNHLSKITHDVALLWSRILSEVPQAKLLLKTKQLVDRSEQRRIVSLFSNLGINQERLILRAASTAYMEEYGLIDIALDTFPRTGGATTADALWMGVPVITLAGQRMISRQGASLLTVIGKEEWIGRSSDEYVEKAVTLAKQGVRESEQRISLHETVINSALCDVEGFVTNLEAAYWQMWNSGDLPRTPLGRGKTTL